MPRRNRGGGDVPRATCPAVRSASTRTRPTRDANGDGTIDVGDVFYLINFLFAGGPAPVG